MLRSEAQNSENNTAEQSPDQTSPKGSSPQVPQSTTSQEPQPDSSSPASAADPKANKEAHNPILVQLLNQDEESDDDGIFEKQVSSSAPADVTPSAATSTQAATPTSRSRSASGAGNEDDKRNEAEAKKKNTNVLLKQLLNDPKTEQSSDAKEGKGINNDLLQKLLQDDDQGEPESSDGQAKQSNRGIIPSSSSSSLDLDFALSLVHSQTMENTQRSRLPSAPLMRQNSLAGMLGNNKMPPENNPNNPLSRMLQRGTSIDSAFNSNSPSMTNFQDENLQKMLQTLWEKEDLSGLTGTPPPPVSLAPPVTPQPEAPPKRAGRVAGVKRKSTALDPDSTDGEPPANNPSQKNVLLAQLLSQRASTETVIKTQSINASAVPQVRLASKGGSDKIIDVPTVSSDKSDADARKLKESKPTGWENNPRTNPGSPFPGNTKDKDISDPLAAVVGASSSSQLSLVDLESLQSGNRADDPSMDPMLTQIIQEAAGLQTDFGSSRADNNAAGNPTPNMAAQSDDSVLMNQLDFLLKIGRASCRERV